MKQLTKALAVRGRPKSISKKGKQINGLDREDRNTKCHYFALLFTERLIIVSDL